MAKITLNTAAAGRVVTPSELRLHSRIDSNEEDSLLDDLIVAATEEAEEYTWRKFLSQTWIQYFDSFADPMVLYFSPVSSITSVGYTDSNGDTQTLGVTIYELGIVNGVSVVRRKYNQDWPTTRSHEDVVAVTFVVGYGAASAVPQRIKQAIKFHAGFRHENREIESVPRAFYDLLYPFRLAHPQAIGTK